MCLQQQGFNIDGKQLEKYYWAGLTVLDVMRMEDEENTIEEAQIDISWKDRKYGSGSKTFYNFKDVRAFLENAKPIKEFFQKGKK